MHNDCIYINNKPTTVHHNRPPIANLVFCYAQIKEVGAWITKWNPR